MNISKPNKSLFITIEGIDGCGKSTQVAKIQQFFLQQNIPHLTTKEPGGTDFGLQIRQILLQTRSSPLLKETQLLLNFANRIEHINKFILPNINNGINIICDRFIDSTYAYQGFGMGIKLDTIDFLTANFINISPDITFLIDVDIDIAQQRIKARSQQDYNYYEQLPLTFHQKVKNGFLDLAKQNSRIKIINGNNHPDVVFAQIITILNKLYEEK